MKQLQKFFNNLLDLIFKPKKDYKTKAPRLRRVK